MKKEKISMEQLNKMYEEHLKRKNLKEFTEEMGIVDEGNIVSDEDLVKVDENGNIIE
ncbi:hypothetical protein [Fusobacterium sp.]|uniref:hypothetical protein n=1 Tax=Fusobacterium sp. TaxID=68766 RepID=UPI00262851BF|nr:hypothetical protein [Fusobacterium sp.]